MSSTEPLRSALELQRVKFSGGLNFDEDGSIVIGATAIAGGGPCDSLQELYAEYLETQLGFADKCSVVQGWRDTDLRARIDKFAAEGFPKLLAEAASAARQTLVHGDFGRPALFPPSPALLPYFI